MDEIYIDGKFKRVNNHDKVITIYTELDTQAFKDGIMNSNYIKYSPLSLLNLTDWVFVNDTLMEDESFSNFKKVEADTIVNGNKIYTELHIFINISSKQLLRFERRNYFNDNPAQIVSYEYTAYDYDKTESKLAYTDPLDFSSVAYGQSNSKVSLSVGQKAPEFLAGDLNGNIIDLKKNLGKKVLLNFSIINCGYCKTALNHFNQENFILSNNITAVYINPIDEIKKVKDYATKFNVPFPVIANANEIGVKYGINAYPTFVLINEEGFIEDIIIGYEEDFIEGLNKS
ncbi:TlpA family protein disulfide reductase [Portibacter lacus]|uniref:Thioredoxin domain-containing protein n=1 Tax=Portibacter lacus TaxID=1099794 RepID=A0AA37SVM7_9BACT|nr:TlpA disulfide reductase family protein [Portibacter lacus]GLR19656.1 hypothetical protein GCM10007940_42720 [Portibacter lacus]